MKKIKGYKVMKSNMTCRGFKFEIGKTYTHKGNISLCGAGFHFCKEANDCFNYYDFNSENIVCEIETLTTAKTKSGDDKSVTDKIRIIKKLSSTEILNIVNTGKDNTGRRNSGDRNSGYRNSGDRNSGDSNSGIFNKTNYCSGIFCSQEQKIPLFNGTAHVLMSEFKNTQQYSVLLNGVFCLTEWVWSSNMTDEEKKVNYNFHAREGYLKVYTYTDACKNWWERLSNDSKELIKSIDGINKKIFKEVTGIKL